MKSRMLLLGLCLLLVLYPAGQSHASQQEAVFARALAFGHMEAVESFCALNHPDLNGPVTLAQGLRLRPISLVLTRLNSTTLRSDFQLLQYLGYRPAKESQMLQLLFKLGANAVYQEDDLSEQTPLHLILALPEAQQLDLMQLLLKHHGHGNLELSNAQGQKVQDIAESQNEALAQWLKNYHPSGLRDLSLRYTPFAYAKGTQALAFFQREVELISAWRSKNLKKYKQILAAFPQNPHIYLLEPPGQSLLQAQVFAQDTAYIQALLEAGNSPDQLDFAGRSALHLLAPLSADPVIIELLLKSGANPNLRDQAGETPLFMAIRGGQTQHVLRLIRSGARLDLKNKSGLTPLALIETLQAQNAQRYFDVWQAIKQHLDS